MVENSFHSHTVCSVFTKLSSVNTRMLTSYGTWLKPSQHRPLNALLFKPTWTWVKCEKWNIYPVTCAVFFSMSRVCLVIVKYEASRSDMWTLRQKLLFRCPNEEDLHTNCHCRRCANTVVDVLGKWQSCYRNDGLKISVFDWQLARSKTSVSYSNRKLILADKEYQMMMGTVKC